jgi:single-stranded-DNA-specific exonuclease
LVEAYNKPAILLTGEDPIHGSARSVEGLNITEAIGTQAALLDGYGGHPMAAGMSLPHENYGAFKRGLLVAVEEQRTEIEIVPAIMIQHNIKLDEISLELIEEIQRLAPFGPGNPPINFMIENLTLISVTEVGGLGEHRQVIAADQDENRQRFIWWNGGDASLPEANFDLVFRLSQSDYRGSPQVSAEWVDFRLNEVGQQIVAQRQFEIIDQRDALNPIVILNHLLEEDEHALVWAEGDLPEKVDGIDRQALKEAETLIIWTAPPGQAVLQEALHLSKPKRVIVFGLDPKLDSYKTFMVRLGGLVKFTLRHKNGQTTLPDLASACAAQEETIRVGLLLWEAMGKIAVEFEGDSVEISANQEINNNSGIKIYRSILTALLEESRAYRHYFRTGAVESIFKQS